MKRWSFGKVLAVVLTLGVCAWITSTIIFGMIARNRVPTLVQQYNQMLEQQGLPVVLSAQLEKAGLFTSRYRLAIRETSEQGDPDVSLPIVVEHGPVLGLLSVSPIRFGTANVRLQQTVFKPSGSSQDPFLTPLELVIQQAFPFGGARQQVDLAFLQDRLMAPNGSEIFFPGLGASLDYASDPTVELKIPTLLASLQYDLDESSKLRKHLSIQDGSVQIQLTPQAAGEGFQGIKVNMKAAESLSELSFQMASEGHQWFLLEQQKTKNSVFTYTGQKDAASARTVLTAQNERVQWTYPDAGTEILDTAIQFNIQLEGAAPSILGVPVNDMIPFIAEDASIESFARTLLSMHSGDGGALKVIADIALKSPQSFGALESQVELDMQMKPDVDFTLSNILDPWAVHFFSQPKLSLDNLRLALSVDPSYIEKNLLFLGLSAQQQQSVAADLQKQVQEGVEAVIAVAPLTKTDDGRLQLRVVYSAEQGDTAEQILVNEETFQGMQDLEARLLGPLSESLEQIAPQFDFLQERMERMKQGIGD